MSRAKKIALLVVSGVVVLGAVFTLFAYYSFIHTCLLSPKQIENAEITFKGALGEAIFSGQRPEIILDGQTQGKTGLDALLAPTPTGNKGEGLIKAYKENPQKFKQYADMLDTAITAKQVGELIVGKPTSRLPNTSELLPVAPNLKLDAWGIRSALFPLVKSLQWSAAVRLTSLVIHCR